jgi:predicted enzyme related to lactoylglutathione lyase
VDTLEKLEIAYVNVNVTDFARAVEFYGKRLGLPQQFADEGFGYASFAAGPVRLGVARIDPSDPAQRGLVGRHTGIGFSVSDLMTTHRQLADQGVSFTMQPQKQPWGGFMALFADPDGNVFYLDEIAAAHGEE